MSIPSLELALLPGEYAVCRLDPAASPPGPPPPGGELWSLTFAPGELSLVCPARLAPAGARVAAGWRVIRVTGPLDLSLVGITAALAGALAAAGVNLFGLATFDTDYLLVPGARLKEALAALAAAGHRLAPPTP